jgi:iron complex outermembrane receptor protein
MSTRQPHEPRRHHEIGAKTRFAEDRVQFNAAVFYYDYQDIQVLLLPPGEITTRLANAEEAEITGAELEVSFTPIAGLDIRFGAGFLDTENQDPQFEGNDLPNAPEQIYNGLVRYEFPIGETLVASAMVDFNYVDDTNKCAEDFVLWQADGYTVVQRPRQPRFSKWSLERCPLGPESR